MKVRVSYATELNSLTEKLSNLMEQNVLPIEEACNLIKSISCILKIDGNNSVEYSYNAIDRVRKSLSEIDDALADVSGLMGGYIKNVLNPEPPQASAPNIHEYKPQYTVPPQEPVGDSPSESE
tara:strand:- start:2671 stop:3039 length:369 start_codon:yes stop_codon:yes gene_type:complete